MRGKIILTASILSTFSLHSRAYSEAESIADFFKEKFNMVCLKVHYKTTDEGKTDDVETIKQFDNNQSDK